MKMDIRNIGEIKFTRNKTVIYDWKNRKVKMENGKTSRRITKFKAIKRKNTEKRKRKSYQITKEYNLRKRSVKDLRVSNQC